MTRRNNLYHFVDLLSVVGLRARDVTDTAIVYRLLTNVWQHELLDLAAVLFLQLAIHCLGHLCLVTCKPRLGQLLVSGGNG